MDTTYKYEIRLLLPLFVGSLHLNSRKCVLNKILVVLTLSQIFWETHKVNGLNAYRVLCVRRRSQLCGHSIEHTELDIAFTDFAF